MLAVLRGGAMSGVDVTMRFEKEYAAWKGMTSPWRSALEPRRCTPP